MTKPEPSCTQITCHGPIEVRSQQARIRTSRRSRILIEDLELVILTPVALIRMKSRTRRTRERLIQEFGSRFTICVKVRNGSGVPACQAGLLDEPSIHPVPVVLAIAKKSVVDAKLQRAVDCAEASERTVSIRDWGVTESLVAGFLAGSSAPCHPVVAVAESCTKSMA